MSTTIGKLIDRVYREYLEPADNVESFSILSSSMTDSVTELSFDGNYFTQEEEDALDAGTIIEVGTELMYSTALDTVNNSVTVKRGVRGTTAAAHSAGDEIKIAPEFPRKNVFDAVCDQIKNLYPTLFAVEIKSHTAKVGYTPLSGTNDNYLIAPITAISQMTDFAAGSDETGIIYQGVAVELVDLPNPFTYRDADGVTQTITYTNNGPNKVNAVQIYGIDTGHEVFVTYKKKFVEPTAEDNTLAEIGLENEYEPIIMAGVAAQVMAGRDIPTATSDYITDQMSTTNFPVNSAANIRSSLLRYQGDLIEQARKDLRARYPEPVSLNKVTYA